MRKLISILVLSVVYVVGFTQTIMLTFTGKDVNNQYVQLHHVIIENVSKRWSDTLYYPDTAFMINNVGVETYETDNVFELKQNRPNPFDGTTFATLQTKEEGTVTLALSDVNGRVVDVKNTSHLQAGGHQFRIHVAYSGTYLLTASQNGRSSTIKMTNTGKGTGNIIEYIGNTEETLNIPYPPVKNSKGGIKHLFDRGDEMIYTGYAILDGTEYSSQKISQKQFESENFVFSFILPEGLPVVTTAEVISVTAYSAICGGNVVSDGGGNIITKGLCWSTSPNPTYEDNHISRGEGAGEFSVQLTNLAELQTYYVRAYAKNSIGIAYGVQKSFTTEEKHGNPCPEIPTVTDYDGNIYNTVQIGEQCWMKENMRTTHYSDGTNIPLLGRDNYERTSPVYRYHPNNDSVYISTYGYLYSWYAAMRRSASSESNPSGVQGICPPDWHIPSYAEWEQLNDYVGSRSEYVSGSNKIMIAKALSATTGWKNSTNTYAVGNMPSGNNATGFSAYPAGAYTIDLADNELLAIGYEGIFITSTKTNLLDECFLYGLNYSYAFTIFGAEPRCSCFSVRCLHNNKNVPQVSTDDVSAIETFSAVCGGNVTEEGDTIVTARGVCWSTKEHPTISNNHSIDGSGAGSFLSHITGLAANTTYYIRAYAVNAYGTTYGEQKSFTTKTYPVQPVPCTETPTIMDYDKNIYRTIQIGNQCWMKENLRTTHYSEGTEIEFGDKQSSNTKPYRYYPINGSNYVNLYGYLYNLKAVLRDSSDISNVSGYVQGICPSGWHVPSYEEWNILINYVSNQADYICNNNNSYIGKALASNTGWAESQGICLIGDTQSSNDVTGFSAYPAGCFCNNEYVQDIGTFTCFWSASKEYAGLQHCISLYSMYAEVRKNFSKESDGYSVRCLRNEK